MKKINRFANDNTSVNPWLEAYETTFEKESDHLCEYLEEKYDDWYNPDSNAYGYVDSPKKILINTGEYLVEAYFDNLDEETYHQYKDTLDKLRGDVNNYDAFVKFVCEKANLPFKTRYDIGKDFKEKEYAYYEHEAKTTTKRLCRIGTSVRPWRQAYYENSNMKHFDKFANNSISEDSWFQALTDTYEKEWRRIEELIESEYSSAYDEDEIVNKTDLITSIGEHIIEAFYDNLDDEIYHQYGDILHKLFIEGDNYDAFVKFIGEKMNLPFNTAYDIGEDYCKDYCDELYW